ncbi:MAG: tryptophan--tRNA ligase [Thermomicrobiales bacterium]
MTVSTDSDTTSPTLGMLERKPRVLSGIQPSGNFHLGNYLGAIRNWARQLDQYDNFFCIVDLHALSLETNRSSMVGNIVNLANTIIASGVDPDRSVLFVQSDVREHPELCWILQSVTRFGELRRMTQFKDKSDGEEEGVSAALFTYPVLQAADILLYDANKVPVGADQRQHIEITRDIAYRFNQRYGETFVLPEADIKENGARIMALDDPTKKMSKSSANDSSYIALSDRPEVIRKKIKRAVTDSGSEIIASDDKPALKNLIGIYSLLTDKSPETIQEMYVGKGYGAFKTDLGDVIVETIEPIQQRLLELEAQPEITASILQQGAEQARAVASGKMESVRAAIGLGAPR